MKKILLISTLLFFIGCGENDIKTSIKNCMNDLYTNPTNEVFERCFYFQNEFQKQLMIGLNKALPKFLDDNKGIKDIKIDILKSNENSGIVNIITHFNNGFISNEKRNIIKVDKVWKMGSETL